MLTVSYYQGKKSTFFASNNNDWLRKAYHEFNNVLSMVKEHVICLSPEERSAENIIFCQLS
jgi:hypothetical protein